MRVGPPECKLAAVGPFGDDEATASFKSMMTASGVPQEKVVFLTPDSFVDLEPSGAKFVLLAGSEALGLFRPDLHPGLCHGRLLLLDLSDRGILGFPVFHPETYRRNPRWRTMLLKDFAFLKRAASEGLWPSDGPQTCVRCRGLKFDTDINGVVYCGPHWKSREGRDTTLSLDRVVRSFA